MRLRRFSSARSRSTSAANSSARRFSMTVANSVVTSTCAAAAPIIGGIGADFFASHFTWTGGGQDVTVPAWTFLFGLACVVGLYSLYRLSFVEETGRTSDHVALRHLLLEVRRSVQSLSSAASLLRIVRLPQYRSPATR